MRAYQAVPNVTRQDFISAMQAHQDADRIVKGTYWSDGRGCAVGCGVESVMRLMGDDHYHSDHTYLADALGIPLVLARLQDRIFEGLPRADALSWPVRFAEAIPDGADLSGVWQSFAPWMLRTIVLPNAGSSARTVEQVAEAYERSSGKEEMRKLRDNAYAASAAAAAAYAASSAAAAAAYAADASAYAAASAAAWQLMADKLCALMAAAPVPAAEAV